MLPLNYRCALLPSSVLFFIIFRERKEICMYYDKICTIVRKLNVKEYVEFNIEFNT